MKRKFILIGHKKRQGKDTFAKMLAKSLGDAEIMAFADPMKEVMAQLLGITVGNLDNLKNLDTHYRNLLKTFGNGKMIEIFGETVWRDALLRRAEKSNAKYIIVPDFRFKREFIEGAITINVTRSMVKSSDVHQSETELDEWDYDASVINDGSISDLRMATYFIVKDIRSGKLFDHALDSAEYFKAPFFEKYNELIEKYLRTCYGEDLADELAKFGKRLNKTLPLVKDYNKGFIFPMKSEEVEKEEEQNYNNLLKDDQHEANIEKLNEVDHEAYIEKIHGGELKEVSLGMGTLSIGDKEPVFGEIFCRFR